MAAPRAPVPTSALRRHGWMVVLLTGAALLVLVQWALAVTANPGYVPSAILLGAAVVPAAFTTFVYGRRLPFDVGWGTIALSALLGGFLGTMLAGVIENATLNGAGVSAMVEVGLIEEAGKLLVPATILLFVRRDRTATDGLLIGVAAGAGFAALETMGYAFIALLTSGGSQPTTVVVLLGHGALSPAGHMAWTGITSAALYAAAQARFAPWPTVRFVGAFGLAVALHTLWNTVPGLPYTAVIAVVSLAALAWKIHGTAATALAHHTEQRHSATHRPEPEDPR